MTSKNQLYIDLWIVEKILKDNHRQEIHDLKNQLSEGLKIKNENGRYVTSDLEVLRQRMEKQVSEPMQLEVGEF